MEKTGDTSVAGYENKIFFVRCRSRSDVRQHLQGAGQTAVQAWVQRYSAPANTIYTGQKLVVDSSALPSRLATARTARGSIYLLGGVHSFNGGLRIRTNSFLSGCG